ncbi:Polyketide synthase-nonribosomal peptide synthetase ACE1 [Labeo rohita]|uniref:Polyketide synthase-nonribosomal peptide synthetase ACE1 n=1 Tax=Labeo rohita TaxID=84645 RepID=A0ABQ8MDR4_LABRO|nr:Polyketide synthase-nonribosomal peptide synthetase ACE1 [Labeo rohita]
MHTLSARFSTVVSLCREFRATGTVPDCSKNRSALKKLADAIYAFISYPQRDDFDNVAQSLIKKHLCLKEPGSEKGWCCFKYSLNSKWAITVANSGPQDVLNCKLIAMVVEMKKIKVEWNKMHMMMANTFSVRQKEIVENEPLMKEVKAKWPGLCGQETNIEDRVTAGMDVGLLIMPDGDDAFDYFLVLEEQIVLRDTKDLPLAVVQLVGLIFALNTDYPKKLYYIFEVFQKIFIELGGDQCSVKVHGLKNRFFCKTV